MSTAIDPPDTVVLVHGLWMTPRSWEQWVPYYEGKGYKVLTPTYPGFEIEVEALREDTSVIASLTVPEVVAHLANVITEALLLERAIPGQIDWLRGRQLLAAETA